MHLHFLHVGFWHRLLRLPAFSEEAVSGGVYYSVGDDPEDQTVVMKLVMKPRIYW